VISLDPGPIRKDPRRIMFYPRINAGLSRSARAFNTTLHIRRIFEGVPKSFLLIGAVRTPIRAVHLGTLISQALGKNIQTVRLPMAR